MLSRVAHAQQADGMRRIGIIVPANSTDMKFQIQVQAFEQELNKLGWMIGQNVQIETRWATANNNEIRKNAAELVALKPDVILAHGSSTLGPLQEAVCPVNTGAEQPSSSVTVRVAVYVPGVA